MALPPSGSIKVTTVSDKTLNIKVRKEDGRITVTDPVTVKNQIAFLKNLGDIGDVREINLVDGAILRYNSNTQTYDVAPANNLFISELTANTLILSDPLDSIYGGTGFSVYSQGDILYAANSTHLLKLPIGNQDSILTVNNGILQYVSRSTLSVNAAVFATNSEFSYTSNNANYLQNQTWENPGTLGSVTPNTAAFSEVSVTGNGYVELNSVSHTSSKNFTSTDIMQKVVAEFPANVYRGGKIMIQVFKDSDNITTISEFLLVHDNDNVYSTEYGIITTGNNMPLASFETNIVSGMVRFLATPITSEDLNFKITETLFLA